MKRNQTAIFIMGFVLIMALSAATEEPPWFDMVNCEFCKHLTDDPELLNHTTWEHHNIANGVINVTTVAPEYMESYHKAGQAMEEVGARMMKGENVTMCGMCNAMGMLLQKGVKMEHIETKHGHVTLLTSDNPEMVAKIQSWGKRNQDEMAKIEQMEHEKID